MVTQNDNSARGVFAGFELVHKQLVEIGTKWLTRHSFGIVVLPEYSRASGEIPDVIGFGKRDSHIVECKVSHTDFLADKHKQHRGDFRNGMGNYRWYLSPGVISKAEIPEQWGLLEYRNGRVFKVVNAIRFNHTEIREHEYGILQSLVRRADIRGLLPQLRMELGGSPDAPPPSEAVKP